MKKNGARATDQRPEPKAPNRSHAWRGTWNRPMKIDEDSRHPFTIARMTDRNVRGVDNLPDERLLLKNSRKNEHQSAESKKPLKKAPQERKLGRFKNRKREKY